MKLSATGLALIKSFEGLRLDAYRCAAGVLTIGYGCTRDVKWGDKITEGGAEILLKEDVSVFEDCVNDFVSVDLTQNQYDALVSLAFNIGCAAFRSSTLLKLVNAGDFGAASHQFLRWNRGGGRVLAGLSKRRIAESQLFIGDT